MLYSTKNLILKNGKTAIFRSPIASDASEMLEYLEKTAGETEFLARYPEERQKMSIEMEAKFLKQINESEDALMIVCIVDGKIAGNCQMVLNTSLKTKHRANVMIALLKEFWGLGIGSKMFEEMIVIASHHHLEQLELQVMSGNQRGLGLYHKFDFMEVGRIPNAFKLKDGSYQDEIYMVRKL